MNKLVEEAILLLLINTDSTKLDDERSVNSPSNNSYIRERSLRYPCFIDPLAIEHPMSGQRQLGGEPFGDDCSEPEQFIGCYYPPYDTFIGNSPEDGGDGVDSISPLRRRRQSSPNRDKKWKLVWPRDQNPRHGRWGNIDRIKDLATGKGPDIWIEDVDGNGPHHPLWTGWKTAGYQHPADTRARWTNLGFDFRQDFEWLSPIKAARREDGKKYDHRTRRYRTPQPGMWSDVVWSDVKGSGPLYFRDETGREWVDPRVDRGHFNAGWGRNPFLRDLP